MCKEKNEGSQENQPRPTAGIGPVWFEYDNPDICRFDGLSHEEGMAQLEKERKMVSDAKVVKAADVHDLIRIMMFWVSKYTGYFTPSFEIDFAAGVEEPLKYTPESSPLWKVYQQQYMDVISKQMVPALRLHKDLQRMTATKSKDDTASVDIMVFLAGTEYQFRIQLSMFNANITC